MAYFTDARLQKVLDTFLSDGWEFAGQADVSSDWWFEDILCLTSTIGPVGKTIYLTLLTDPGEIRQKIVWCIGISGALPVDRHFHVPYQLTLKDINKIDLSGWVKEVSLSLR